MTTLGFLIGSICTSDMEQGKLLINAIPLYISNINIVIYIYVKFMQFAVPQYLSTFHGESKPNASMSLKCGTFHSAQTMNAK